MSLRVADDVMSLKYDDYGQNALKRLGDGLVASVLEISDEIRRREH